MYEFKMPALGSEMTYGTLLEWKVKTGDRVKAHDIIAIIDTDKAAIEVESFRSGIVEELIAKPGDKVPVGTVLAHIRESEVEEAPPPRAKISPLARKLAEQLNVDAGRIQGTGPGGSVVEADIRKAAEAVPAGHSASMQKAIAGAMAKSKREIPHYYLSSEMDLTHVMKWLEKYNSEHPITERIIYPAFLIRAVTLALKKHPQFNGFFINGAFQPSEAVHLGFAISLRGGGLIAPALLNSEGLNLGAAMKNLTDLVARTRSGKLKDRELSDPTITLTNLGEFGADSVLGVIYPPQVALIGFGRVNQAKKTTATLSADHRVTNGLSGSRFLETIHQFLKDPEKML
jgi:pyruvate dehydrogenase E2 component (dihydrolipoyllysine-residue acetyltransferase)